MGGLFETLQEQQKGWVVHNFGDRPAWMPLLGIVEEIGELDEAIMSGDRTQVIDALADAMIFAADYCTAMGWNLAGDVFDGRRSSRTFSFPAWTGKLAHAHLKRAQSIRGTGAQHERDAIHALRVIVWMLDIHAKRCAVDLEEITFATWTQVRERDWVAHPKTGLPEGG